MTTSFDPGDFDVIESHKERGAWQLVSGADQAFTSCVRFCAMPDAHPAPVDPNITAAKLLKRHVDAWLAGHFGSKPRAHVDVSIGERATISAEVQAALLHLCLEGHSAWGDATITDDDDAPTTMLHLVP